MTYIEAKRIMQWASTFCVIGPTVMASAFFQRAHRLPHSAEEWQAPLLWTAMAATILLGILNWFRFARPLYRLERPDLIKQSLNFGGFAIMFLPLAIEGPQSWGASWAIFWGTTMTLISFMVEALTGQVTQSLQRVPEKQADTLAP